MQKTVFFIFVFAIILSTGSVHAQIDTSRQLLVSSNTELKGVMDQMNPQKYKVAGIKVTGNTLFASNLLLAIGGVNEGSTVVLPGGDELSKSIRKLWVQNSFSDITYYLVGIRGNDIYIELNVTERPKVTKYYFRGVGKSQSDDLKAKAGITPGHALTDAMIRNAVEVIRNYFSEKGFRQVSVDVTQEKDSAYANSAKLYFDIHKGQKVKVGAVTFFGNSNLKSSKLRSQLKNTKEVSRMTLFPPRENFDTTGWGFIPPYTFKEYAKEGGFLTYTKTREIISPYIHLNPFVSSKFDEKKYEDDKQKLITYYNSKGYRDAKIIKDSVYYDSKGNINIALKVSEGDKYYFGKITWVGNTVYSDSILNSVMDVQRGEVYNVNRLMDRLGVGSGSNRMANIKDAYLDYGYLFADVSPVESKVYNDTIDFVVSIREGPIATLKKIDIAGNDKTNDHVIRRALETRPGEVFSKSAIMQSIGKLSMLKFFDEQKMNPVPTPNQTDGTVDITYNLVEKSADQLQLSAGFGGGIGVTGTLGVTLSNFSIKNILNRKGWQPLPTGDGQTLSVNYQSSGRAYHSINAQFVEPWLGGRHQNGLSVNFSTSKFRNGYNYLTNKWDNLADTASFGTMSFGVGYSKQLTWPDNYFNIGASLNYTRYMLHNYTIDYSPEYINYRNGNSNDINLRFTLQRNSLNSAQFPTTGSNIMAFAQLTPPYSLFTKSMENSPNDPEHAFSFIEYQKYRFTGDWYVALTPPVGEDKKQLVLRLAAKMGFVSRYTSKMPLSPFERFQLGDAGMSNTYSFLGYDIVSQRGYPVYDNSDPSKNPDQTGATDYFTIFNKYTMELRYPLSLSQSSTIFGLVFAEAANGWYSFQTYNPFQLRRSVGVGARFYLPMFGLLGFDYGIGFDRLQPGQSFTKAGRFTFMLGYEPD